jgi:hypothetical protein
LVVLDDRHPKLLWDGYLSEADGAALRAKLAQKGALQDGYLDFMFATPWRVGWTLESDCVAVYSRHGLAARVTADGIEHRGKADVETLRAPDIADVFGEGAAFHARTRVRVRLKNGRVVTLVSVLDLGNWFDDDPWEIYEQWPRQLAREIRRRLGLRE